MFRKRRGIAWAGGIFIDSPIAKVKVNSEDHARAKSTRKLDKHSRWAVHFLLTSLFKLEDKSFALSLDSASLELVWFSVLHRTLRMLYIYGISYLFSSWESLLF